MKIILKILFFGISMTITYSCDKEETISEPKNDNINKIMPLGASRVQGDRPNYERF